MSRFLLTALALAALCGHAQATTIIGAAAAAHGLVGPAGLSGTFYNVGKDAAGFDIAPTLAAMKAATPTGQFTATTLSYSGSDSSTVTSFLGGDGGSYKGRAAAAYDLSDGIFDMKGFLYVSAAGTDTFSLSHDDAAQLSIGGQTLVSADCCGTDTATVTFQSAGYYAIDVIYENSYYGNGTGGANFLLAENGATLTASSLVQSVPEPASLALFGAGLFGVGTVRRRSGPMTA